MPGSEVLSKILDDFTAKNPDMLSPQLKTFCDYAATWLSMRGVIGVGHTTDGISLRFANGGELLLFEPVRDPVSGESVPVQITGTQSKITKGAADEFPSFPITGR